MCTKSQISVSKQTPVRCFSRPLLDTPLPAGPPRLSSSSLTDTEEVERADEVCHDISWQLCVRHIKACLLQLIPHGAHRWKKKGKKKKRRETRDNESFQWEEK